MGEEHFMEELHDLSPLELKLQFNFSSNETESGLNTYEESMPKYSS